jgi:hypothetical protein
MQGVAFFSVLYQVAGAFPDGAVLIQRLAVFYKQRDAHFYPAWCFAAPQVLLRMPWAFVETWIWTLMVYFMVGFLEFETPNYGNRNATPSRCMVCFVVGFLEFEAPSY